MEVLLSLLGILFVGSLFVCVFVLPVLAFVRSRHIAGLHARLQARLERVERELARLRQALERHPAAEAVPPETARSPAGPAAEQVVDAVDMPTGSAARAARPGPGEEHPARPRPAHEPPPEAVMPATEAAAAEPAAEPEVLTPIPVREVHHPRRRQPPTRPDAATLEAWIGRQGLGWAAVILLLFATAFFLKYAFDNQWVGELGRVSLGVLAGAALCVAGYGYHRRGWRLFGQMLSAAGVVLLYLTTFSAFGYYHLIPQERAGVFLVLLVAETAALAVLYEAPAIALMAVVGGLLTPLLLHTDRDQYRSLFTYLAVLDAGAVGLALFRRWRVITPLALLGTQALFWAWYAEHYHPEKLAPALLFQAAVFALFLAHPLVRAVGRRDKVPIEELAQQVVNAFLFALAVYVLLDPDYHPLMGTLALGLSLTYTGLAWLLLLRRPQDPWHVLVAVATGLAFLAAMFPLQVNAAWIAVGWAAEGLALWWFGLRVRNEALRVLGTVLLVLGVGRLLLADLPWGGREPFVPVFNRYALPALAVAACVATASLASRRFHPRTPDTGRATRTMSGEAGVPVFENERAIQVLTGLTGVLLIWLVLSLETYQFFTAQEATRPADSEHLRWVARASLSVLWAVYAGVVMALGFRLESVPLRWTALGLLALTLAKVILVDMAGLPGIYRVVAFFILSLVMGAAAWGYQKLEAVRRPREGEVEHEKA